MKEIADSLGLGPLKTINADEPKLPAIRDNKNTEHEDTDYNIARDNFHAIIEKGSVALEDLLEIAAQSQHPRAYEVFATTMKTLVEANKELVELSRSQRDREKKGNDNTSEQPAQGHTHNTAIFIGSTESLQQHIERIINKVETGIDDE